MNRHSVNLNSGFKIREFSAADEAAVIRLWKTVFENDPPWNDPELVIRRKQAFQCELFLVGELNSELIATVLGGYDGFRGWIYHLAVLPSWQHRGIARMMMMAIEGKLLDLGCIKINLQVRASNFQATDFYRSVGYSVEDHISMGKLLQ